MRAPKSLAPVLCRLTGLVTDGHAFIKVLSRGAPSRPSRPRRRVGRALRVETLQWQRHWRFRPGRTAPHRKTKRYERKKRKKMKQGSPGPGCSVLLRVSLIFYLFFFFFFLPLRLVLAMPVTRDYAPLPTRVARRDERARARREDCAAPGW